MIRANIHIIRKIEPCNLSEDDCKYKFASKLQQMIKSTFFFYKQSSFTLL